MNSLLIDLRQAIRGLRRSPGSAIIAVLALTLGIGLTTLMFSIVWGALFRGLPLDQADELYAVERTNRLRNQTNGITWHDLRDWSERQSTFEELGGFWTGTVNVSGGGADEISERYDGAFVQPSVLRLLGIQPVLGRIFRDEDDLPGAVPVMILGYEMWQNRFHGDPAVIGRTLRANAVETEIVGVLPERFGFPNTQQLWLPTHDGAYSSARGKGRTVRVIGRLKDGVTADQATLDMDGIARQIAAENPETNENMAARLRPYTDTAIGDEPRTVLLTMLGAVGFVLLIACANVANLLIGRAIMRTREVGIRTSMGASRLNVALPFLAESAVLSLAGAIAGIAVAFVGLRLFTNAVERAQPPFWLVFEIDALALAFVAAITVLSAVLAGVIPAVQAARLPIGEVLKDESRGASSFRLGRLSRILVVVEMALSVGLLVGAGLMIKSVVKLASIDLGFPQEEIFTARVGLPEATYGEPDAQQRFFDELETRLAELQGARGYALAEGLPGMGTGTWAFSIEGRTAAEGERNFAVRPLVTPGYFDLFDAPPVRGRDFTAQDRTGSTPVAIVNEAFERRWFEGTSALGARIRLGGPESEDPWITIVGIVRDLRPGGLDPTAPAEAMYLPVAQNPARFLTVVARTSGPALGLTSQVREMVTAMDRDIPLYFVQTLAQGIDDNNWFYKVFGTLFAVFGVAALFLAAVGLYGVMSFSVGQRTRELGVRMAIGAQPRDVIRMVLGQGMRQVIIGLAAGTVFALAVSRLITAILFNVSPRDPWVFAVITVVLATAAFIACGLPATRATRVDPLQAMRSE